VKTVPIVYNQGTGYRTAIMQPSFLLDTSAFKALSASRLEAASQSASLCVSPFCFWELLEHLEDNNKFHRVKGNLMKFRHVVVLDDPHAEVCRLVLPLSDNVHSRVRDGDLVNAALAALADSNSTEEFYQRYIRDESGQVRQIAGCVSAVRETLQVRENGFKTLLRAIASEVRAGKVRVVEVSDYDRGVEELSRGWWLQIGDKVNGSSEVYGQFVRKTYRYHFYLLHRAREYAERNTTAIDPEPNDFEDARLCLQAGLADFTGVVTNDEALNRCLRASGVPSQSPLQVWNTTTFPPSA
jgi:hypothetical protein